MMRPADLIKPDMSLQERTLTAQKREKFKERVTRLERNTGGRGLPPSIVIRMLQHCCMRTLSVFASL
jgi:hypothetical protein